MSGKVIAVAVLTLSFLMAAPITSSQEVEKRDLSRYEKGEEESLRDLWGEIQGDEAAAKARVRRLVWERWRAKRMAYVSIRYVNFHGDSQATNYYVEPDGEGRWRVAVESVSSCCGEEVAMGLKQEVEQRTRDVGEYYIVSRVGAETHRPVPEGERREPESYYLLLSEGKPLPKGIITASSTHKL